MRIFSAPTAAQFVSVDGFHGHVLVWFTARDRETREIQNIGFWSGADHQVFMIDGQERTYYAAGEFLAMDPIRRQTGIKTKTQRLVLNSLSPAAMEFSRGYDPRHHPVEIHRALFDPLTENLVDEPHILMRGFLDKAPSTRSPKNEAGGQITVEIATHARALTRSVSRYRSDATLRARGANDAFRQYASDADNVETPWGRGGSSRSTSGGSSGSGSSIDRLLDPHRSDVGSWGR